MTPETEIAGVNYGYSKVIEYTSKGISAHIDGDDLDHSNPIIDTIFVEFPFDAVSKEGLFIGMNEDAARAILELNFYKKYDDELSYSIDEVKDVNFFVWFKKGKLVSMAISRSDYEDI